MLVQIIGHSAGISQFVSHKRCTFYLLFFQELVHECGRLISEFFKFSSDIETTKSHLEETFERMWRTFECEWYKWSSPNDIVVFIAQKMNWFQTTNRDKHERLVNIVLPNMIKQALNGSKLDKMQKSDLLSFGTLGFALHVVFDKFLEK